MQLALLLALLVYANGAHADVVKCTEDDGMTIFQVSPCKEKSDREALSVSQNVDPQVAASLLQLAKAGNIEAQISLGNSFRLGTGVEKDPATAFHWYEQAAGQGDARGELSLAGMYFYGLSIPQNYEQAVYWTERSAAQGYAQAIFNLGQMYATGNGKAKDMRKAVLLIRQAADARDPPAQTELGKLHATGNGVKVDYDLAQTLWQEAAKQDYAPARHQLEMWQKSLTENFFQFECAEIDLASFRAAAGLRSGTWHFRDEKTEKSAAGINILRQCHFEKNLCTTGSVTTMSVDPWRKEAQEGDCSTVTHAKSAYRMDISLICAGWGMSIDRVLVKKSDDEFALSESTKVLMSSFEPGIVVSPHIVDNQINASYAGPCEK